MAHVMTSYSLPFVFHQTIRSNALILSSIAAHYDRLRSAGLSLDQAYRDRVGIFCIRSKGVGSLFLRCIDHRSAWRLKPVVHMIL